MLPVLTGEVSMAEAARREEVSEASIGKWKAEFLEAGKSALTAGRSGPSSRESQLASRRPCRHAVGQQIVDVADRGGAFWGVTFTAGYALPPTQCLEELDMGGGSTLWLKVTGEQSHGLVTVLEGVVRSGGPPVHVHDAEDEVVVILEGQLDYQVGDDRGTVGAGGLLWFPRQVPHAIANLTGQPCRFLTVVTPSGIEDFFRAQRDYLASLPAGTPPDPGHLAALDGAKDRRVIGPPLTTPPPAH